MLLITQPRVGTSHNEILALQITAREKGWDVLPAPTSWRLDDDLIKSGVKGVPYGSQTFCEVIAQQMGWTLRQQPFDWLARLPYEFVKRRINFMTLGEAKKEQETKFIKPADDKVFLAGIYPPGTLIVNVAVPDDTPTLVSSVVEWEMEYRCFVGKGYSNHYVFAWSNYLFHGQINEPHLQRMIPGDLEHPDDFMRKVLWHCFQNDMTGPCVIDIGVIPGKGWAVVETNQAWASGIYGCDPSGVLDVLEQACY